MRIQILLFAQLREAVGYEQKTIEASNGETVGSVARRFFDSNLAGFLNLPVRFALNEDFVAEETLLKDGDRLAIIPPVAGG
ncbi:MAG: MoaD/ThiS family protein [Candidatus Omnitrophica bacterium]|nr:MoaD/ThiS family protein [Candidatus Omnitrophota bacterium]